MRSTPAFSSNRRSLSPPSAPVGWEASAAVGTRPIAPWSGFAWRGHRRRYAATDWRGSLYASGRYHRAPDLYPQDQTWPALYLGLSYGVCLGEVLRHLPPELFAQVGDYRLSKVRLDLKRVADCRDLAALRLRPEEIFDDLDYRVGQALAAAIRQLGCEGMLVPSATRLPDHNLIVFPDRLDRYSHLGVEETVDPSLYVERPGATSSP